MGWSLLGSHPGRAGKGAASSLPGGEPSGTRDRPVQGVFITPLRGVHGAVLRLFLVLLGTREAYTSLAP